MIEPNQLKTTKSTLFFQSIPVKKGHNKCYKKAGQRLISCEHRITKGDLIKPKIRSSILKKFFEMNGFSNMRIHVPTISKANWAVQILWTVKQHGYWCSQASDCHNEILKKINFCNALLFVVVFRHVVLRNAFVRSLQACARLCRLEL